MKTKKTILFSLLISFALVSCGHDSIDEPSAQTYKIPIDSIYFSCKIDGNLIEMKNTDPLNSDYSQSIQRLYKLKNNSKDSVIIAFSFGYFNDDYRITIGISKACLLDTIDIKNFKVPLSLKKEVMETSNYQMQFMPPISEIRSSTDKYYGFYIEISDLKNNCYYTTYYDNFSDYNNKVEYNNVSTNSGFKITKSTELNSGIYANYQNTWFIESNFNCKIYKRGTTTASILENVTDGVLRGCF